MKCKNFILIVLFLFLLTPAVNAQENSFSIENLNWLSGQWNGEAFGGTVEEVWSDPSANAMMGMFRLQYDNVDKLYEFLLIENSESGITMKFKHIKSGYKEMEDEPILLKLIQLKDNFAEFAADDKSLIIKYSLVNNDYLEIELTSTKVDKTEVTPINMKRKN